MNSLTGYGTPPIYTGKKIPSLTVSSGSSSLPSFILMISRISAPLNLFARERVFPVPL